MINDRTTDPRIDVLIPVYNVEETVTEAVESIFNQTYKNFRVIVIDDGSTDGTAAKLAELAARDSRLLVQRQSNGGIVDALNNGLKLCRSEFIARQDGDDVSFPDRFERQMSYLETHVDCIAVGANAFHIDESGRRIGSVTSMKDPATADASFVPAREPYLIHPLLLLRREKVEEVGGYRHVFHSEDADLYWRLRGCGKLHNMNDVLAEYRIHSNSVSGKSVVNGRIQAVSSQLAALSERRRVSLQADLKFPRERLDQFKSAKTIRRMMLVAEADLQDAEVPRFRIAVAAKMLELESYRPYALDYEDRDFVKEALVKYSSLLSSDNMAAMVDREARYIATLLKRKEFRAALQMTSPSLVMPVVERLGGFLRRRIGQQI